MIELKLTSQHLNELFEKGYTLEMVYILKMIETEGGATIWQTYVEDPKYHPKWQNTFSTLNRKGLLSGMNLTLEGKELLKFLSVVQEIPKLKKVVNKEDDISKFWKVFPATDQFEHKGQKFVGSRALRINKEGCRIKLKAILNTGEYTIEEILSAIEYDVLSKKEASVKERNNKLKYLQNSLTYLNQMSFEPYIELIKQGNKIKESNQEFDGINI